MKTSLNLTQLSHYASTQLNHFFPDDNQVNSAYIQSQVNTAIEKLEFCFECSSNARYNSNEPFFNHLYSDHYLLFLWHLSNCIYKKGDRLDIANKLYYLNKTLHAFDCLYNTNLPDIFLILHGAGTMLGKAEYQDYFVCYQGCTVGASGGEYPKIGRGVILTSHSSVIGKCSIGNNSIISSNTAIFNLDIPASSMVYFDQKRSSLNVKKSSKAEIDKYFKGINF